MSARHLITVARIDNGYLIEYSTGQTERHETILGTRECDVTGTRHAATAEEAGGLVEALLNRFQRAASSEPKKVDA